MKFGGCLLLLKTLCVVPLFSFLSLFSCCVILYCVVLALKSVSLLVMVFSVVGLEFVDLAVCQLMKPLVPSGPLG